MIVDAVFEERYWYPHDGGIVWLAGYGLVDADGRFLGREAPELAARGLVVVAVAGARHHEAALQSDAAAPGRPLVLRREPDNPHDPHAVAVDTADAEHLGYVPRELAATLTALPHALALRESRASPRDPRTGLTMLLAPEPVELRRR